MPYADSVNITLMDDVTAAGQAEAGLKQQALPYSRRNHKGGVTFIIRGRSMMAKYSGSSICR